MYHRHNPAHGAGMEFAAKATCSVAKTGYGGSRTRFIPSSLLDAFEEPSWAPARTSAATVASAGPRVDLAARMKEMWR